MMKHQTIKLSQPAKKPIVLDIPGRYTIELIEPGATTVVKVRTKLVNKQKADYHIVIKHLAPATKSRAVLKGVVNDQAQLGFFGKIIIAPNCQRVSAFLEERILLLSDEAKAEVVPDLEILSHDVICSHAATMSYPDEAEIFYLMSRGLSRQQAIKLIVQGFLAKEDLPSVA